MGADFFQGHRQSSPSLQRGSKEPHPIQQIREILFFFLSLLRFPISCVSFTICKSYMVLCNIRMILSPLSLKKKERKSEEHHFSLIISVFFADHYETVERKRGRKRRFIVCSVVVVGLDRNSSSGDGVYCVHDLS